MSNYDFEQDARFENESIRGTKAYEKSRKHAEDLIKDPDRLENFLNNLEKKLSKIPKVGHVLANIPILVAMVRSHMKHEYPGLPLGTLIGVVAALVYFVSPVDIIPDSIPGVGHVDDALVIAVTMAFIGADVEAYKQWKQDHKK